MDKLDLIYEKTKTIEGNQKKFEEYVVKQIDRAFEKMENLSILNAKQEVKLEGLEGDINNLGIKLRKHEDKESKTHIETVKSDTKTQGKLSIVWKTGLYAISLAIAYIIGKLTGKI